MAAENTPDAAEQARQLAALQAENAAAQSPQSPTPTSITRCGLTTCIARAPTL